MKNYITILFFCFTTGCNQLQPSVSTNPTKEKFDTVNNVFSVEPEDEAMNKAIATANKTLAEFDKALQSKNEACTDFAVKKRYHTSDKGGEHMWIAGLTMLNDGYKGFINNDAQKTTEVAYGDTVFVKRSEITDWMYLDKNVLKGGYTIRAVRDRLKKEDRIRMDKEMGFTIED